MAQHIGEPNNICSVPKEANPFKINPILNGCVAGASMQRQ